MTMEMTTATTAVVTAAIPANASRWPASTYAAAWKSTTVVIVAPSTALPKPATKRCQRVAEMIAIARNTRIATASLQCNLTFALSGRTRCRFAPQRGATLVFGPLQRGVRTLAHELMAHGCILPKLWKTVLRGSSVQWGWLRLVAHPVLVAIAGGAPRLMRDRQPRVHGARLCLRSNDRVERPHGDRVPARDAGHAGSRSAPTRS
ncbi:hypothetical protein DSM104443_00261 [Usitatibacter rugosus]|uniref:Uncharacterized protein n=1 Tax=Usitatibacter rugosus TaxID=2732067 RepID=A0A6M4GRX2_9PROT|nr:hypothetical protein DSM104443_00261 [Usitatibacter rugosus]